MYATASEPFIFAVASLIIEYISFWFASIFSVDDNTVSRSFRFWSRGLTSFILRILHSTIGQINENAIQTFFPRIPPPLSILQSCWQWRCELLLNQHACKIAKPR